MVQWVICEMMLDVNSCTVVMHNWDTCWCTVVTHADAQLCTVIWHLVRGLGVTLVCTLPATCSACSNFVSKIRIRKDFFTSIEEKQTEERKKKTCATPAAISIFMARPSSGTPSYCFIAATILVRQGLFRKIVQWCFLSLSQWGQCLSARQELGKRN